VIEEGECDLWKIGSVLRRLLELYFFFEPFSFLSWRSSYLKLPILTKGDVHLSIISNVCTQASFRVSSSLGIEFLACSQRAVLNVAVDACPLGQSSQASNTGENLPAQEKSSP
jgi:hypothetical protein